MTLSEGPGRFRDYRGGSQYEVPADLSFYVCPCGAEWMTSTQIDQLSEAFEAERTRRQADQHQSPRA